MLALVDYLTFSVPSVADLEVFKDCLFGHVDWQHGHAAYGYLNCVFSSGIRVFYEKPEHRQEVCVSMSGSGCRTFETLKGEGFSWSDFFRQMQDDYGVHFSRLDVALDVKDQFLLL